MNKALQQVIGRNDTWRGNQGRFAGHILCANSDRHWSQELLPTGYSTLDSELQRDGWPVGNTIELLSDGCGLGAMGLFLPAMRDKAVAELGDSGTPEKSRRPVVGHRAGPAQQHLQRGLQLVGSR